MATEPLHHLIIPPCLPPMPVSHFSKWKGAKSMKNEAAKALRKAPIETPTSFSVKAGRDISGALNALLADTFALYIKTKNFHWHISGPHFRDYHLLLDEQAGQIFATTDEL